MKRLALIFLIFSNMTFAVDYIAEVGFELRQTDAYSKLSNFLFWKNYVGAPTFVALTNFRTGEVTYLDQITELSVAVNKGCYNKIKSIVKSNQDFSNYVLYFRGPLKQLNMKMGKKSKVSFKQITECVFEEN